MATKSTAKKPARKDGKPTRADRKAANRALFREVLEEEAAKHFAPVHHGRQTTYDPEFVDVLLERISAGETLKGVCREMDYNAGTVRGWIRDDRGADPNATPPVAGLATRYARARELQAEAFADDIVEIADTCNEFTVQKAKLRADNRKWLMGRNHVARFGDRVTTTLEGGTTPVRTINSQMSLKEAAEAYQATLRGEDEV